MLTLANPIGKTGLKQQNEDSGTLDNANDSKVIFSYSVIRSIEPLHIYVSVRAAVLYQHSEISRKYQGIRSKNS